MPLLTVVGGEHYAFESSTRPSVCPSVRCLIKPISRDATEKQVALCWMAHITWCYFRIKSADDH